MVEVITTDEFAAWYHGLDERDGETVDRVVGRLEVEGIRLGFPHSSAIEGSRLPLRELRAPGRPIRIFYAFDPNRDAVLLIGGDKTGDDRFYERMTPMAERIWSEYLREVFHR